RIHRRLPIVHIFHGRRGLADDHYSETTTHFDRETSHRKSQNTAVEVIPHLWAVLLHFGFDSGSIFLETVRGFGAGTTSLRTFATK
ncbi:MAG: hypothetical protein KDN19_19155, partial [Verrucomicrobiae bacterium]|nr:hypothetical protein [Verrucomicrobiae bacterium]